MFAYERHRVTYTDTSIPQPLTQGEGDTLNNDIVLGSGENNLLLTITEEQYTKLLSAALNGACRYFPDEYLEVIYPLIKAGKIVFCDAVDDCIENNPSTTNIINQVLLQSGDVYPDSIDPDTPEMDNRFTPAERDTDYHAPPASCDKDALWAGIYETVTRLDELTRDFYEDVVSSADKGQRAANVINAVPIFGSVLSSSILAFVDIAQDILNGYNSHSSTSQLEDVACDLFEMVCDECRYPTFDEYYDYYASFGISGIQDIANYGVQAAIDYLIGTNGLANAVIWYSSNAIALYTMYLGGEWLGRRGSKWLAIWADIGEDNPDNGWELLCSGCDDSVQIPATGNAFDATGNIYHETIPANSHVTIEYLSGVWDYNTEWEGSWAGDPGETDPDAVIPTANLGALIALNPEDVTDWFLVGSSISFDVITPINDLYITMNDVEGGYVDNHGALLVRITVTPL
jgi:hypothetical protein